MSTRRRAPYTQAEIRQLVREVVKRMVLATGVLLLLALVLVGLVAWLR